MSISNKEKYFLFRKLTEEVIKMASLKTIEQERAQKLTAIKNGNLKSLIQECQALKKQIEFMCTFGKRWRTTQSTQNEKLMIIYDNIIKLTKNLGTNFGEYLALVRNV